MTWFSDEASFHLSEYVNSYNMCASATVNPMPFTSSWESVGYSALSYTCIIGPTFYYMTIIINVYLDILQESVDWLDDQ
jgi:hypothetical protein